MTVGAFDGLVRALHYEPVATRLGPAGAVRTQADDDVEAAVLEVECMGAALAAVAQNRDLPVGQATGVNVCLRIQPHDAQSPAQCLLCLSFSCPSSRSTKKTPLSWSDAGSRMPVSGYALPALSSKEKERKRGRQQRQFAAADVRTVPDHVHDGRSCCMLQTMSNFEISVTCDTKSASGRPPHGAFERPFLMSSPGWRSIKHMLFLPPGTKGPGKILNRKGGEAGTGAFRMATEKRESRVQRIHRRGRRGQGRVRMRTCNRQGLIFLFNT